MIRPLTLAALLMLAGAALAHGPKAPAGPPAVAEQKDWGIAGDPRRVSRTVRIAMDDRMRFTPAHIEVRQGETLRLEVSNRGRLLHELVIGTADELERHAALMQKFPDMQHDEPYMAHVDPGKRAALVWTFNRPGDFQFACLIAGHFQAGMVGTLRVLPTTEPK